LTPIKHFKTLDKESDMPDEQLPSQASLEKKAKQEKLPLPQFTKEELEKLPLPVKYRAHKQTKKASSELHEISTQLNLESNSMFNSLFVQSLNIKEAEE
jgi:hypothetical protein